jgi:hypothetical protein
MPIELVPWDGREGAALKTFLDEHPTAALEDLKICVLNFYQSDGATQRRPARAVIPELLEHWNEGTNQYGTPRSRDQRFQREQNNRRESLVGAQWRPP